MDYAKHTKAILKALAQNNDHYFHYEQYVAIYSARDLFI